MYLGLGFICYKISDYLEYRCFFILNEEKGELNMGMKVNSAAAQAPEYSVKKKRQWKMPHVYVVLFIMMIMGVILTYIVPSGSYQREATPSGAQIVVPGTFEFTTDVKVSFFDFFAAIPNGLVQAGPIIFGGLMMGGLVAVLEQTGLLPIGMRKITAPLKSKTILLIPILMIPIAIFTNITGALEMALIYIPIIVPLTVRMGFDRFTGVALVLISSTAGFSTAITAPATVGLAQQITELPLYSGALYRAIILAVLTSIGILFVWRYAKKVQQNPEYSYVYGDGIDQQFLNNEADHKFLKATARQKWAFVVLGIGFIVMLYGLLVWKWYFIELGGWYAFLGIAVGLICGMTPSKVAEVFHEGFKSMLLGALLIGIARSISIILESGQILDTIVYGITEVVGAMPSQLAAVVMLIFQGLFNFLVGSGSGQAMITMPVMSGLADILGVTRQTAVLAFQFGDGFTNMIYPTGALLAFLSIAHIPYGKWLRFFIPLFIAWLVLCAIFLVIAQFMNWGAGLQ